MAKYTRRLKPEFQPKEKELEEFPLKELKARCEDYDIPSTGSKDELVKRVRSYENGKYIKPVLNTTSDPKNSKTLKVHFIGIHLKDRDNLIKMGLHVQKGEARRAHYASDYCFYIIPKGFKLE